MRRMVPRRSWAHGALVAIGAPGIRALCKLVAAARKERFGAKPGSAVTLRRCRNMIVTSTVVRFAGCVERL